MPQNLKSLTSMRFFAAMWVVAFHFWENLGSPMPAFVAKGYLGVELFFVLSGFILCHVYLERFKDGGYSYREFIWARLARIYPLHIAILAGLALLIGALAVIGINAGDKLIVWSSLPAQITLTQAWGLGQGGGWNHPSWSISAEWFAYLTFPAFAYIACRLWNRPRLAVGLALGLLVALYIGFEAVAGFPLTRATILWGALRIVPCFALGCTVWLAWNARVMTGRLGPWLTTAASVAGLVTATTFGLPDFVSVAACGGLIFGLASLSSSGSKFLAHKVFVYLGEVSFAVYMICIPWQLVFVEGLQKVLHINPEAMPLPLWLALYLGVIPAAMVMHHAVERPARELMRKVTFRAKPQLDVKARLRLPA